MIIRSAVEAQLDVADEMAARHGQAIVRDVERRLVQAVLAEGENVGAFIRPQSVRVQKRAGVQQVGVTTYIGSWHPDPREGVYFIGGPLDGSTE